MKNATSLGIFSTLTFATLCGVASAQIGGLDPSFSGDGIFTLDIATDDQDSYAVAVQSDGKLIIACDHYNGSDQDAVILRLNADGTLDNTFDSDGIAIIDLGGEDLSAYDVEIQGDGKIVFGGVDYFNPDGNFMVGRLNSDGSLDASFDTDGIASADIGGGSDDQCISIALQADGKIIAVGYMDNGTDGDVAVARFNTDGSLDNSFDSDGVMNYDSGLDEAGFSVAEQTDGKIVISGYVDKTTDVDFAVMRLDSDGALDPTFDTDGIVLTDISGGGDDDGFFLTLQSDGKILVAGDTEGSTGFDLAVVRYNTDGSLDNTFDGDGYVITDFAGGDETGYDVMVQSDGKIIALGSSWGAVSSIAVARYNSDGTLDLTFDSDGKVTTDIGGGDDTEAYRGAIQADGKIVVAGYWYKNATDEDDIAVARYLVTDNAGIDDLSGNHLRFVPNPFSGSCIIHTAQEMNDASVNIYNTTGQCVTILENIFGNSVAIDGSQLAGGMYYVRVAENGLEVASGKVLVQE